MRRRLSVVLVVLVASIVGVAAPAHADATPIMGRSVLIADQINAWFQSTGRTPRPAVISVRQLAQLFLEEGAAEGVRGDVAFAQTIFETGYLQFSETVPPEFHNYAGIGAPNDTAQFPDARTGVRAQIQHLRAYADPTVAETGTAQPLVDPRFDLVNPKGQAKTVEELSGRWSGGADYGQKIVAIYQLMREHAGPTLRDAALGEPIVRGAIPTRQGGTWLADGVGGVFALAAPFHGSLPQLRAAGVGVGPARTVAVVGTPSGGGYWLADELGGIHAFGDAEYFGSIPQRRAGGLNIGAAPVVDVVAATDGLGYWLIDEVGGVHTFGGAPYFGSIPQLRAMGLGIGDARMVTLVVAPGDAGYWMLDVFGGVFAFGGAPFLGSAAGSGLDVVGAVGLPGGVGYRIFSADGAVVSYR